ncbi:MAG: Flagellar motor switch protein FliG [Planctomycetes bacterium ADurb.Bin412]|nr:MAG: Flagellar motor switch protein FliG [Planctomycetes bacterium ADurb.Bin412]
MAEETDIQIPGLRKAAIVLLSLGQDIGAQVISRLERDQIEDVSRQIAELEMVRPEEQTRVLQEFYTLAMAHQYIEQGGLAYAQSLLEKSLSANDASEIIKQVTQTIQQTPFQFLQKAEAENVLTFIQDEHPQTIALILAHLQPTKSSEILMGLSQQKQVEVIKRIASMEQTNPEVIKEVEAGLEHRLSDIVSQTFDKAGGVEAAAEILNLADRSTEKGILESLETDDPDLVEQIRRLMFVFEDILLVNDKGIQSVLKEVDNDELALALKTASEELKQKIFGNMSDRASQLIREDMDYMGPVRLSDVEMAQQKIVDIVRRLEEAGEIIIQGRGGESEMVV